MSTVLKNPYADNLSQEEAQNLLVSIDVFMAAADDLRDRLYSAFPDVMKESDPTETEKAALKKYTDSYQGKWAELINKKLPEYNGRMDTHHAYLVTMSMHAVAQSLGKELAKITAAAEGRELTA